MKTGPKPRPSIVRFWEKVGLDMTPGGCWYWMGNRYPDGYGQFKDRSYHTCRAHRWIYEYLHGPIGSLHTLHRCDTPLCVRPSHLFTGTQLDNMRDMIRKGRHFTPFRK